MQDFTWKTCDTLRLSYTWEDIIERVRHTLEDIKRLCHTWEDSKRCKSYMGRYYEDGF